MELKVKLLAEKDYETLSAWWKAWPVACNS